MLEKNEVAESTDSAVQTTGFGTSTDLSILKDALEGECAGLDFQFDRIKIPAGGGLAFEVPGEDEEPEMAKTITAVIAYQHPAYAYYATKFQGGSNPPDCGSLDGIHGTGNPGGLCKTCRFNQFGSGGKKAKACKNRHMLYLIREGEIFPVVINLPTGSLRSFKDYVKHQLTKGRRLSEIVTEIKLVKDSNEDSITFSKAVFKFVRTLTPEEKVSVGQMTELIKGYAENLSFGSVAGDDTDASDIPFVDADTGEIIEPLK